MSGEAGLFSVRSGAASRFRPAPSKGAGNPVVYELWNKLKFILVILDNSHYNVWYKFERRGLMQWKPTPS